MGASKDGVIEHKLPRRRSFSATLTDADEDGSGRSTGGSGLVGRGSGSVGSSGTGASLAGLGAAVTTSVGTAALIRLDTDESSLISGNVTPVSRTPGAGAGATGAVGVADPRAAVIAAALFSEPAELPSRPTKVIPDGSQNGVRSEGQNGLRNGVAEGGSGEGQEAAAEAARHEAAAAMTAGREAAQFEEGGDGQSGGSSMLAWSSLVCLYARLFFLCVFVCRVPVDFVYHCASFSCVVCSLLVFGVGVVRCFYWILYGLPSCGGMFFCLFVPLVCRVIGVNCCFSSEKDSFRKQYPRRVTTISTPRPLLLLGCRRRRGYALSCSLVSLVLTDSSPFGARQMETG